MVMTVLQEVNGEDASPEKRSSLSGGEANEAAQLRQALLEAQGEIAGLRLALAAKESVRRSEDGSNEPRSARLSLDPSSARRARRLSVEETATTARRTEGRRQAGLFELRVSLRSRARREEPKPSSVLTSTPPVPNSSRRGSPSRSVSPKESRAAGTEVKAQFSPPRPEARTRSLSARAMRKFAELNAHKEEWPDVRREAAAAADSECRLKAAAAADSECRSKAGAAAAVSECRLKAGAAAADSECRLKAAAAADSECRSKAGAAAADSECRLKAGRTHECRKDRPPGASPVDAHCIETVRRTSGPTVRMTHPVQVRVPVMPLGAPRFASTRATRLSLPAGLGHTWVSRV
ncbi:unnamed protein product [Effrenium voratum]|uniref:Uncharacterized protein n=1 Tax=Effrenium voratum TaxID=2562239 RepID=A0AA36ITF5_9DINO|nr:unnamed protein product [Effrenium voratum]